MQHFLQKSYLTICGAGGGGSTPPAPIITQYPNVLSPPQIGNLNTISSFSYGQMADLISEGPIEGIVRPDGNKCNILEGIYLDNKPILTSSQYDSAGKEMSFVKSTYKKSHPGCILESEKFFPFVALKSYIIDYFKDFKENPVFNSTFNSIYCCVSHPKSTSESIYICQRVNKFDITYKSYNPGSESIVEYLNLTNSYSDQNFKKYLNIHNNQCIFLTCININAQYVVRSYHSPIDTLLDDGDEYLIPGMGTRIFYWSNVGITLPICFCLSDFGFYPTTTINEFNNFNYYEMPKGIACGYFDFDGSESVSTFLCTVGSSTFHTYPVNFKLYIWSLCDPVDGVVDMQDYITNNICIYLAGNAEAGKAGYSLYNFNYVESEFKDGSQFQNSLSFFNNIEIEYQCSKELIGPYSMVSKNNTVGSVQRLTSFNPLNGLAPSATVDLCNETSDDRRYLNNWPIEYDKNGSVYLIKGLCASYSTFDSVTANRSSQPASSVIHTIYNENVQCIYLTISVDQLFDMNHIDLVPNNNDGWIQNITRHQNTSAPPDGTKRYSDIVGNYEGFFFKEMAPGTEGHPGEIGQDYPLQPVSLGNAKQTITAGTRMPSIVSFIVQTSYESDFTDNANLESYDANSYFYRRYDIYGLSNEPALLDIGRIKYANVSSMKGEYTNLSEDLDSSQAIILPPAKYSIDGTRQIKRVVKITRVSHETLSTLIGKKITLAKVTEIIPQTLNYPFSSIVATRIDSRSFAQIPVRSFDCKLKKVLVPSNYYPFAFDGSDRRYVTDINRNNFQIYYGNWDGTFKLQWTDNPAWILLDLLINKRYGLGNYIEVDQIDIWELYKIAKWCDACNDDGFFIGVKDEFSEKNYVDVLEEVYQPRYVFNAIIQDRVNIFEIINQVASIFDGSIFYINSLITFDSDRIKPISGVFTSNDVKDGLFNLSNHKKDDEFTAVEVSFLDKTDNFIPKLEYVEDSEAIRKIGLLKKKIDGFGITSRSQARRFGKAFLYNSSKEISSVSFITDAKALLYKPGDLISIQDEIIKSRKVFGKIDEIIYKNGPYFDGFYINDTISKNYTNSTPQRQLDSTTDLPTNTWVTYLNGVRSVANISTPTLMPDGLYYTFINGIDYKYSNSTPVLIDGFYYTYNIGVRTLYTSLTPVLNSGDGLYYVYQNGLRTVFTSTIPVVMSSTWYMFTNGTRTIAPTGYYSNAFICAVGVCGGCTMVAGYPAWGGAPNFSAYYCAFNSRPAIDDPTKFYSYWYGTPTFATGIYSFGVYNLDGSLNTSYVSNAPQVAINCGPTKPMYFYTNGLPRIVDLYPLRGGYSNYYMDGNGCIQTSYSNSIPTASKDIPTNFYTYISGIATLQ
jgi:hypothetical protein